MNIKIKVDAAKRALDELAAKIREATAESMREALEAGEAVAKARIRSQTKSHTGRLLESVQHVQISATRGKLFALAPYAGYIDSGTKPHIIEPKRAKVLAFQVDGQRVFRRRVRHPGTAARPFILPADIAAERVLHDNLSARAANLAGTFNR